MLVSVVAVVFVLLTAAFFFVLVFFFSATAAGVLFLACATKGRDRDALCSSSRDRGRENRSQACTEKKITSIQSTAVLRRAAQ